MYCVQNRKYCDVCNKPVIPNKHPNQLKSQGHVNIVLRNECTKSVIIKTHYKKKLIKTELVNKISNEAIYQLQYYKILFPAHKMLNKIILIVFSTVIICLIVFHVYCSLKVLINLLIELFLRTSSFSKQSCFTLSLQTLSNISFLILLSPKEFSYSLII